jgi:hypothetical protein
MVSRIDGPLVQPISPIEYRERVRHENEQVEHFAQPWRAESLESGKAAIAFAQSIIKTSQLLNGGGLLAIPALATLFSLNVQAGQRLLLWTGLAFGLGLLFAWLCNFCGYFSQDFRSQAERKWAEAAEHQIRHNHRKKPDEPEKSLQSERDLDKGRKLFKRSDKFVTWGVVFAFLSLISFIGGSYLGHRAITEIPQRTLSGASTLGGPVGLLPFQLETQGKP